MWTLTYVAPARIAAISSSISPVFIPCVRAAAVAAMLGLTSAAKIRPEMVAGGVGTRLDPGRAVSEVGAEEYGDPAVHAGLTEMDVRLLNGAFQIRIAQLPFDLVATDAGVELPAGGSSDTEGTSS